MNNRLLSLAILLLCVTSIKAQQTQRTSLINEGWSYLESNIFLPEEASQLSQWESIDLPHSWNATDATDLNPGYRRGAGWYKYNLQLQPAKDKKYFLYFEGANITTYLYVNGQLAGTHIGGYIGFEIEISELLKNGDNEIMVRVDNDQDREIIPSSQSDFFIYGGITRDVWLKTVSSSAYIDRVKIATASVSKSKADATFEVVFGGDNPTNYEVSVEVLDPKNKSVFKTKRKVSAKTEKIEFKNLKNPALWDVKNPNLYSVRVEILKGKEVVDVIIEKFGYRWFEFQDHGAFFLNGERVLIRGTHRHEEQAGKGAAMSNEMHRKDIEMVKEMGANMLRLAHYPQDPEVYKACDELGIIVWDELPWCRGGLGNDVWKANTTRLLVEMIEQNRNHPSIMFWSLGNELYWLPDFENGDDTSKINEYLVELNDLAHELDPGRLTALRKYYEGSNIVDVFSPSIWSGWYSGVYESYGNEITKAMKKYKRFIHAEYGGSSHLGRHTETKKDLNGQIQDKNGDEPIIQVGIVNYAKDGDWSENYMVDLMDWHLKVSETTPNFPGNIQWAFKDFATPLRPENDIPYMNQKGILDRAGNPKDVYYVYKSYWSDQPFVYIESATWTERYGAVGELKDVSVYSSCKEVQLLLNGQEIGKKVKDINKFPASGLNWSVEFKEGKNQLIAIGYSNGRKDTYDTLNFNYHVTEKRSPIKLELSYVKKENGNLLITATALDDLGRRCTTYEKKVYFQSLNGGELIKHQGTPQGSDVIAMANGQASIEFVTDPKAKTAMLSVLNQDFKGTYLEIPLGEE